MLGGASAIGLAAAKTLVPTFALLDPAHAQSGRPAATPAQTLGPFYPAQFPDDVDHDLTRVTGRDKVAEGEITHVSGNLFDTAGKPLAGAQVEIWQCNAHGRYHHPLDTNPRPLDPDFQGYGRVTTDAGGGYYFRTIRPVPYPGRTPHIHFRVSGPSIATLVTQLYIAGHPQNETDVLLRSVRDKRDRDSLLAIFQKVAGTPEWRARWDIVVVRQA